MFTIDFKFIHNYLSELFLYLIKEKMNEYNFNKKRIKFRDNKGLFVKLYKDLNMKKYIINELRELDKQFKFNFKYLLENVNQVNDFNLVSPFVFPIRIIEEFKKKNDLNKMRFKKQYNDKYNKPKKRSVKLLNYLFDKYEYVLTSNNFGYYYRWLLEHNSIESQKTFLNRYLSKVSHEDIMKDIDFKKTLKELM